MSHLFESSHAVLNWIGSNNPRTVVLNASMAKQAQELASKDASKLLYTSLMTFSDALNGIEKRRFSWSIVKLYYSIFYSVRSILCSNGIISFHADRKAFQLECLAGRSPESMPNSLRGSTHKWAFYTFRKRFASSPLIAQDIEGVDPFDWLMQKREESNYKRALCYEPSCPDVFRKIDTNNIRKFIAEYIGNPSFAFDPDHAIISYPLYVLRYAVDRERLDPTFEMRPETLRALDGYLIDRRGKLPTLLSIRKRIGTPDEVA